MLEYSVYLRITFFFFNQQRINRNKKEGIGLENVYGLLLLIHWYKKHLGSTGLGPGHFPEE